MERFRTVIDIPVMPEKISYHTRCLLLGSCFAGEIGEKMQSLKFPVLVNPFGTLFNPASISNNLNRLISGNPYTADDLDFHDGMWFSFSHYTGFARSGQEECLDAINRSFTEAADWIKDARYLVITFGTAWTYIHKESGKQVANCHKLPSSVFSRELLDPATIAENFREMLAALWQVNPGIRVIFTVSPVRHWKDGAVNNQLSKSVLLLGIHDLLKHNDRVIYFPAYEIFMDELRDYRFYAGDMLHPSEQGVEYVWERFCDTFIGEETKNIMAGVTAIVKAVSHRPRHADSPNLIRFRENTLRQINQLTLANPFLDFTREIATLRQT